MLASLRWRLVLLAAVSIVLALGTATAALRWTFERYVEQGVERELDVKIGEILSAFRFADGGPWIQGVLTDPRYEQPLSGAYWQVSANGVPVLQSRSLWDQTLAMSGAPGAGKGAYEVRWPNGALLYAKSRDVTLDSAAGPKTFRLTVAIDHQEIDAIDAAFIRDAWRPLGGIGLALLLGAWLQLEIGLRPLRQLKNRVAAIKDGRAARLEGGFPAEVAPLADEFNALLAKQAEAMRRGRERAGSLAHGLKTPITILYDEADRLEERGLAEAAKLVRLQLGAMNKHVGRELARARSHGAASPGELTTDARRSVDRLIALVSRMPRGRDLEFRNEVDEGLSLQIDPDDFGEVLGNLLDNARKFAANRVAATSEWADGRAKIFVADDGPGIPQAIRESLIERGERADDEVEGSGLGFSIVRDLLADYGTKIEFARDVGVGCKVGFSLPAARRGPTPAKQARRPRIANRLAASSPMTSSDTPS